MGGADLEPSTKLTSVNSTDVSAFLSIYFKVSKVGLFLSPPPLRQKNITSTLGALAL